MDDVVHVISSSSSRLLKRAKRLLTKTNAYGDGLSLMQTRCGEAFGVRWRAHQGNLEVEQELKWIPDFVRYHGIETPSYFYEAGQMDTNRQAKGVLVGYILRMADCANVPQTVMETRLTRLVLEMRRHGHSEKMVRSALLEAGDQLLLPTKQVLECLSWSKNKRDAFIVSHDTEYRLMEKLGRL